MRMNRIALILFFACLALFATGCCQRGSNSGESGGKLPKNPGTGHTPPKKDEGGKANLVEQPLGILEKTGLNYSIDSKGKSIRGNKPGGGAFFEQQYVEGIDLMEKGEFTKAVSVFEAIIKRYPNTEEASVAELCIAELYFRNKSNSLALQAYERIVENYPNSHAAENARSGIKYLKDFEIYEKDHVPTDIEDRKRRGY